MREKRNQVLLSGFLAVLVFLWGCRGEYKNVGSTGEVTGDFAGGFSDVPSAECKKNGDDCNCLVITLDEARTLPPSIVSFSFSADTCSGEPVFSLTEDNIFIYEDGITVSKYESDFLLIKRPRGYYIPVLILIDLSGSIVESGNLRTMQNALLNFVRKISDSISEVAIYGFDGREDIFPIHTFTRDISSVESKIWELDGWRVVDESTNLNGAVVQGIELVEKRVSEISGKISRGILVVFTDGTDQASRVSWEDTLLKIKESKVMIFSIGLGGEVNKDILGEIGRNGFEWARNSDELTDAFDRVAQHIFNLGQRFYTFAYCSPKRAGEHTATLVISWRGFVGKAEFRFRADGFEGGCSRETIKLKLE